MLKETPAYRSQEHWKQTTSMCFLPLIPLQHRKLCLERRIVPSDAPGFAQLFKKAPAADMSAALQDASAGQEEQRRWPCSRRRWTSSSYTALGACRQSMDCRVDSAWHMGTKTSTQPLVSREPRLYQDDLSICISSENCLQQSLKSQEERTVQLKAVDCLW